MAAAASSSASRCAISRDCFDRCAGSVQAEQVRARDDLVELAVARPASGYRCRLPRRDSRGQRWRPTADRTTAQRPSRHSSKWRPTAFPAPQTAPAPVMTMLAEALMDAAEGFSRAAEAVHLLRVSEGQATVRPAEAEASWTCAARMRDGCDSSRTMLTAQSGSVRRRFAFTGHLRRGSPARTRPLRPRRPRRSGGPCSSWSS